MPTISPERGQSPGFRPGGGPGHGPGHGPSRSPGQPGRARLPQLDAPPGGRTRERLRAVGAVLALVTIVAGVPAALVLLVGSPIPVGLSGSGALTDELDSASLIALLSGVVWLAWAHFVVCVVAETRSELRGNGLNPRVPFGGGSQTLARRLVATTLLLSGAAILVAPSGAEPVGRPTTVASGPSVAGDGARFGPGGGVLALPPTAGTLDDPAADWLAGQSRILPLPPGQSTVPGGAPGSVLVVPTDTPAGTTITYYEVRPPDGRHYDTLWGIAERFLSDGMRYREIFELNQGRMQPDGRSLTKPALIHPGWVLVMPSDARGEGLGTLQVPPTGPTGPGAGPELPTPDADSSDTADMDGGASGGGGTGGGGTEGGGTGGGGTESFKGSGNYAGTGPVIDASDEHSGDVHQGAVGTSLLAAGVVVALSSRKPRQGSPDEVSDAETALRLAADLGSARFVDRALRLLSAELSAADRPLPPVYAAILTDTELMLFMAPPDEQPPPAPWRPGDGPGTWRIERNPDTPDGLPLGVGGGIAPDTPAPYPGLVTLGRDDHGSRVLVDLEGAPGVISVSGHEPTAREVAVSAAVELATNLWSDDLRVCLVGFSDELTPIAPHRIRSSPSLESVLDELDRRGEWRGRTGAGQGADAALQGRQAAWVQALWAPDLLVLSAPPTETEAARLATLSKGRVSAVGVLAVGDFPTARWRFVVDADGRLSLGVLGLEVAAQRLAVREYAAIVEMFREADEQAARSRASNDGAPARPVPVPFPVPVPVPVPGAQSPPSPQSPQRPAGTVIRLPGTTPPAPSPTVLPQAPEAFGGGPPGVVPWVPDTTAAAGPTPGPAALPGPAPVPAPVPAPAALPALAPAPAPAPAEATVPRSDAVPTSPPPSSTALARQPARPPGPGVVPPNPRTPPSVPPPNEAARPAAAIPAAPLQTPRPAPVPTQLPAPVPAAEPVPVPAAPPTAPPAAMPEFDVTAAEATSSDVEIRFLGTPTVEAPGSVDPDRLDLLTEVVVYLALHRDGVHPRALAAAVWPRGVPEEVVTATFGHLLGWLGVDGGGRPRLAVRPDGRWQLGPDVRCDWDLFTAYAHRAHQPTSDTEIDLTTALRMVSGPLWSNLPPGRYGWLAPSNVQTATRGAVVDVAHRLTELTLGFGDTTTAMAACRTGLRAVPTSEILWRDLLRTVAARGDRHTLEAVVNEMYRTLGAAQAGAAQPGAGQPGAGRAGAGQQAEPETDALVQELLPGFRRRH